MYVQRKYVIRYLHIAVVLAVAVDNNEYLDVIPYLPPCPSSIGHRRLFSLD